MLENIIGETGATILQFVFALIVVVALVYLVAWALRKWGFSGRGGPGSHQAELQVVNTLALDSKRKLVVVRHGQLEHLLLIGGGSDAVVERSMVGGLPLQANTSGVSASPKSEPLENTEPVKALDSSPKPKAKPSLFSGSASASTSKPEPASAKSEGRGASSYGAASTAGVAAVTTAAVATTSQKTSNTPDPLAPLTPPPQSEPTTIANLPDSGSFVARDEREAIDQSLDFALSESLLGSDTPAETTAEPSTKPTFEPKSFEAPVATKPAAVPTPREEPPEPSTPDEPSSSTALEKELEAALDLDHFEEDPKEDDIQDLPLPPLAELPGFTEESDEPATVDGDGEPKADTETEPQPEPESTPTAVEVTSENLEEPPKTTAQIVAEAASKFEASTSGLDPLQVATLSEPSSQPDMPPTLSGRDTPPIPVPIPTRGPGSNATTLATAEDVEATPSDEAEDATAPTPDDVEPNLDISEVLNAAGAPPQTAEVAADAPPVAAENPPADETDLDDEMRRLLGEIAGEAETK